MVARQHRAHSNCPICDEANEDVLHVLVTCQHHSASEKRESLLQELKVWLQSVKTDPDITTLIISGLRSCFLDPFGDEPLLHHTSDATTTFAALTRQLDIGWFAFMCGYITTPLIKCQHSYYRSIDSLKHGTTSWGCQLSSKLWNLTRSIWIHRNSVLHDTSTIHELSGLATLRLSITAEYNCGCGDLPMPYSPFFYSTLPPSLLSKSVIYLRRWFMMTVRSGRECHQPMHIIDDFTTNTALRV